MNHGQRNDEISVSKYSMAGSGPKVDKVYNGGELLFSDKRGE